MHAVNGKDVPANHRALFLWCSMIWITSVSGVHITSKRNIVSETISNVFLSMRADVTKLRMLTSEPAEHGFGNTRKVQREFTCADFASHSEKENRRMDQMFQGKILPSREKMSGYLETFADFIEHGMLDYKDLSGGHGEIESGEGAKPVSEQLWPYVHKVIAQAEKMMSPLLKLAGVTDTEMSPFCKSFATCSDLLRVYVAYCPRTFTFDGVGGEKDDEPVADMGEVASSISSAQSVAHHVAKFVRELEAEMSEESIVELGGDNSDAEENDVAAREDCDSGSKRGATKSKRDLKKDAEELLSSFTQLVKCSNLDDLFECALDTSAAIDSVDRKGERGAVADSRRSKSLLTRWWTKSTTCNNSTDEGDTAADAEALVVERDSLVTLPIKCGRGKNATTVTYNYRVLGLYDKSYHKWWMTGEKQRWSTTMKAEDKKKYKLAVRMVKEEAAVGDYNDVEFDNDNFDLKEVRLVVDGSEITGILGMYALSNW